MVAMLPGVLRTALLAGSIAAVTLAGACTTQAASAAGTTIITVQVANRDGSAPGPEAMKTVRDSLTSRLTGAGLGQVAVSADGSTLLVSMAGAHSVSELNLLLAPGELRFRKVIDSASELRMWLRMGRRAQSARRSPGRRLRNRRCSRSSAPPRRSPPGSAARPSSTRT